MICRRPRLNDATARGKCGSLKMKKWRHSLARLSANPTTRAAIQGVPSRPLCSQRAHFPHRAGQLLTPSVDRKLQCAPSHHVAKLSLMRLRGRLLLTFMLLCFVVTYCAANACTRNAMVTGVVTRCSADYSTFDTALGIRRTRSHKE
jgi:hypothetical protein